MDYFEVLPHHFLWEVTETVKILQEGGWSPNHYLIVEPSTYEADVLHTTVTLQWKGLQFVNELVRSPNGKFVFKWMNDNEKDNVKKWLAGLRDGIRQQWLQDYILLVLWSVTYIKHIIFYHQIIILIQPLTLIIWIMHYLWKNRKINLKTGIPIVHQFRYNPQTLDSDICRSLSVEITILSTCN